MYSTYLAFCTFTCASVLETLSKRLYFQSWFGGNLQKITRSFVYARQFSRFCIQSVTNSEKRRNYGRCGFSLELENSLFRRWIQIRSSLHVAAIHCISTCIYTSLSIYQFLSTHCRARLTDVTESRSNECAATCDRWTIFFDTTISICFVSRAFSNNVT